MAYYAELKRKQWYCICGTNMINFYRRKIYDDWYTSLTDEQKETLRRKEEQKKAKERKKVNTAIMQLAAMTGIMMDMAQRSHHNSKEWYSQIDGYNDYYDQNGNIKK